MLCNLSVAFAHVTNVLRPQPRGDLSPSYAIAGGTPFLPPVTEQLSLELIEARTFGSRVIYERYRCLRDDTD